MRILYLISTRFPNERAHSVQVANTCHALASRGCEVTLCVAQLQEPSLDACMQFYGLDVPGNLTLTALSKNTLFPHMLGRFRSVWKLRRLCKDLKKSAETFVYARGPEAARCLCYSGCSGQWPKLVFESHRLEFLHFKEQVKNAASSGKRRRLQSKADKFFAVENQVFSMSNALVCTTHSCLQDIKDRFAPNCPTCVIPNATSLRRPVQIAKDIDILYSGSLSEWKGVDTLISAMQYLPQYKLTVVGGSIRDQTRLVDLGKRLGVLGRVRFLGHVSPSDVTSFLDRARVGVLPTLGSYSIEADRYTSPLKLFDYMMNGLPVVASDLPSTREILENNVTGVLVPSGCAKSLANGIRSILKDDGFAGRIADRAREHCMKFTWEERAKRIMELLSTISQE
jgi:glycosyltransferase involved in cell wall biosynthesis